MAIIQLPNKPPAFGAIARSLGITLLIVIRVLLGDRLPRALTVKVIARAVRFPRRARANAFDAVQQGEPVHPSPSEIEARALTDRVQAALEAWWRRRCLRRQQQLEAIGLPGRQRPFARAEANLNRNVAIERQSFGNRYRERERDAQRAELYVHRLAFELGQQVPRYKDPLVVLTGLLVCLAFEIILGAPFFEKASPAGLVGAAAMVLLLAVPLILLTFVAFGVFPRLAHRVGRVKIALHGLGVAVFALAGAYALVLAHFRHVLQVNKAATLLDAWTSLWTAPVAFFATRDSVILFGVNLLVMGLIGVKAPVLFEQWFGLAMAAREAQTAREEVTAEVEDFQRKNLPNLQAAAEEEVNDEFDKQRKILSQKLRVANRAVKEFTAAREQQRRCETAFTEFRQRLHTELKEWGALPPPCLTALAPPTPGSPEAATPMDAIQLKRELLQDSADLVDAREAAEVVVTCLIINEIKAVPDLCAKIRTEITAELATPPLRQPRRG